MMVALLSKEDTLEIALEKINTEINNRRSYGVRREEVPSTRNLTRCMWSNGSARWYCGSPEGRTVCPGGSEELQERLRQINERRDLCWHPKGESEWDKFFDDGVELHRQVNKEHIKCHEVTSKVQCVDANEICVHGAARVKVKAMEELFDRLPLYSGSFEARGSGAFSLKGIEIPPGIHRQRLDDLDPQTIQALVDKAMEEA